MQQFVCNPVYIVNVGCWWNGLDRLLTAKGTPTPEVGEKTTDLRQVHLVTSQSEVRAHKCHNDAAT